MKRVAWLTDPHLNFVDVDRRERFYESLAAQQLDALLVSGDVGEADSVEAFLSQLDDAVRLPLHFVLGNHDFYFGAIRTVRAGVCQLVEYSPRLHYLSVSDPVELAPGVGLVGHDGWADGRIGDYERSHVMMNDYRLIEELAGISKQDRLPRLMALAEEAAQHLRHVLPLAVHDFARVILVTHVPPWREACWYEGQLSDDEWAPHFTCKAVGDAIVEVMRGYPQRQLTVLCGHTHSSGEAQIGDNIVVWTGQAEYGQPAICRILEL